MNYEPEAIREDITKPSNLTLSDNGPAAAWVSLDDDDRWVILHELPLPLGAMDPTVARWFGDAQSWCDRANITA
jgi:hypothetical protein